MSRALIELEDDDVFCSVVGGVETRLPYAAGAARLVGWAERYNKAAARDAEAELLAIGREMFDWLDGALWASGWADGAGDRELEIRVRRRDDPREVALLDAPWELLARDSGPLALDATQSFTVARRIGTPEALWAPRHHDLQLMFMAAAPRGQADLDFEREEATVLEATRGDGRVHVIVEETGSLAFLGGRLTSEEGPFEAVHLSCHGDIETRRGPVLLLETAEGEADLADPGQVVHALGAEPAPLVVLSACRTAEIGRASGAIDAAGRRDASERRAEQDAQRHGTRTPGDVGAELTASFARQLATQVANVVGWDGSVYDRDAADFAQAFYGELGRGSPVPRAAAAARRVLLRQNSEDRQRGRHWHLARVYLGPRGGGALCAAGKPKRKDARQLQERGSSVKAACRWRRGRSSSAGGVQSSRCCVRFATAPGCWSTAWGRLASRAWRRGCSAGCAIGRC
jgi:hypothetical protein